MNVQDRRRLLGPPNAKVPKLGQSSDPNSSQEPIAESEKSNDIRNFFIKTGLINNANGSSYFEIDDTIIEVGVFGPRPIRGSFIDRASFSVECKFLPYINQPMSQIFNNQDKSHLSNIETKISTYVETALLSSILLEKYPKSTIDIFINVISFNSSKNSLLNLINWIINSSSVALVNSGIELKDLVTSGQVIYNEKSEELRKDCSIINDGDIECVASFMNMKNNEIVAFWIEGDKNEINENKLNNLINGCNDMSKIIRQNINSYLLNN